MIGIQIILLLVGLPFAKEPFAIRKHLNIFEEILFQILGVICYGFYVLLKMPYQTISYIWGVFCLIPFVFAIASVIYKSLGYKKYSIVDYSSDNPKPLVRREGA
jgi:Na+/proline symporter